MDVDFISHFVFCQLIVAAAVWSQMTLEVKLSKPLEKHYGMVFLE